MNTRDKIVLTTIELIANQGLSMASAGNISSEGGFTKSNIFYYFESLDQLFLEAVMTSIKEVSPILRDDFENYINIEAYLNTNIENLIQNPKKISYLKLLLSLAHETSYLRESKEKLYDILIHDIYRVLVLALSYYSSSGFNEEDTDKLASLIMSSFNGLGVILLIDRSPDKFMDTWRLQSKLIHNFIGKN